MIAAVAVVLLVSGAGSAHPLIASMHAPFWALVLGFAAAERFVVHIHFRRSAHSMSMGEIPLVFGLLCRRSFGHPRPRARQARDPGAAAQAAADQACLQPRAVPAGWLRHRAGVPCGGRFGRPTPASGALPRWPRRRTR